MDEYSSSLILDQVTAQHSGNYTCIAGNVAGRERYDVPLTVNGKKYYLSFGLLIICFTFIRSKYLTVVSVMTMLN